MFCDRLKLAMKRSGMRAADLARLCNVKPQSVAGWLRMKEARLAALYLFCISDAMRVDPRRLAMGNGAHKRGAK